MEIQDFIHKFKTEVEIANNISSKFQHTFLLYKLHYENVLYYIGFVSYKFIHYSFIFVVFFLLLFKFCD